MSRTTVVGTGIVIAMIVFVAQWPREYLGRVAYANKSTQQQDARLDDDEEGIVTRLTSASNPKRWGYCYCCCCCCIHGSRLNVNIKTPKPRKNHVRSRPWICESTVSCCGSYLPTRCTTINAASNRTIAVWYISKTAETQWHRQFSRHSTKTKWPYHILIYSNRSGDPPSTNADSRIPQNAYDHRASP